MLAHHHPLAQVVDHRRAHLRSCINGVGVCKGAQERIGLLAVAANDRPVRCPGVKGCAAVSRQRQSIPDLPLRGCVNTGFSGRKGCAARFGAIGSGSAFTRGSGADGREAARVASFAVLSEATAGESLATFAVSSICGMEQIRRSAAMTICHLSIAGGCCKSVPTREEITLLVKRSGNTGPLVTFELVRPASPSV